MKKILLVLTTFSLLTSCDMRSEEHKELLSRKVRTVTVIDVATGDTIQLEFSGNPGVADIAFKK